MKYQYKKTVEVIVEGDLPLLGYDVKHAAAEIHDLQITEAIRLAIKDKRPIQKINIGDSEYQVQIYDYLNTVRKSPFNPDE